MHSNKLWTYCEVGTDVRQFFVCSNWITFSPPGLFRIGTYASLWSAQSAGVTGNMKGDGTLLGSTLVVGRGEQGILFQHRSREFQDRVDPQEVLKAVKKIGMSS